MRTLFPRSFSSQLHSITSLKRRREWDPLLTLLPSFDLFSFILCSVHSVLKKKNCIQSHPTALHVSIKWVLPIAFITTMEPTSMCPYWNTASPSLIRNPILQICQSIIHLLPPSLLSWSLSELSSSLCYLSFVIRSKP